MSAWGELAIAFAMGIGMVGIIIPVIPGLGLVWVSALVWAVADGGGGTRWTLFAIMTVLFAIGTYITFALPASASRTNSPRTLAVAGLCALAGFFLIPVVGTVIGFAAGVFAMTVASGRTADKALTTAIATVRAFGVAMGIQLGCAGGIAVLYIIGLLAT